MKHNDRNQPISRLASGDDVQRIATLSEQLGYPASAQEIRRRLQQVQQDKDHAVYVAEQADGRVVGWVHVYLRLLLVADLQAEIGGLVVDEECRQAGIGQLLMQRAEQWARDMGCQTVGLRSNVIRREAHLFYERIGYTNYKTSRVFRKIL